MNEQDAHTDNAKFSLAEARHIVSDLFEPNERIYWLDFLSTTLVALTCFVLVYFTPDFSLIQIGLVLASSALFYRAVMFTHELTHLRHGEFVGFRIAWNLLCGIPFLAPSFTYYRHIDHHRRQDYGTKNDAEYLPFGKRPPWELAFYLAQVFFIPIVVTARFLLITPLTWVSRRFRDLVLRHASTLVVDLTYVRPLPDPKTLRWIRFQEALCFVWIATVVIAPYALFGPASAKFYIHIYATAVIANILNTLRTLGAHRYLVDHGSVTFVEQLEDSINYPHWPLTAAVWAPVGLRYHALHHLFPSLPYHNLGAAHRRLMEQLPADSTYRSTVSPSLPTALWQLFRTSLSSLARKSQKQLIAG